MSRRLGGPCVWFALVGLVVASLHSEPPSQPDAGPPAVQADASPSTTALVTARLESVERFFATELPTLYGTELAAVGGIQPYDPNDEATLPRCNGSVAGASFYSQNAFFCREENLIVYDAVGLLPDIRAAHGELAVGVLVAHEYSHAVQSQVDAAGSRLELELQADCFAGAWAATQATTGVDLYRVVTALTLSADPADTTVSAAAAHGTGYERTAAFVHGHREGAVGCLEHPGSPTESPPGA